MVICMIENRKFRICLSKLRDCPQSDDYIVVGIESEKGFGTWDTHMLQLLDLITTHIVGRARPMHWVEIVPVGIRDKTLTIVRVQSAPPDELFFIDGQAPVREGNRTVILKGADLEQYKETRRVKYVSSPSDGTAGGRR